MINGNQVTQEIKAVFEKYFNFLAENKIDNFCFQSNVVGMFNDKLSKAKTDEQLCDANLSAINNFLMFNSGVGAVINDTKTTNQLLAFTNEMTALSKNALDLHIENMSEKD